MKIHKWKDIERKHFTPQQIAKAEERAAAEVMEMNLKALREMAGLTQAEAAKVAEMTQGELSRQERRADHLVSTLRRYVQALGGELELVARFDNKTIRLSGV